MSLCCLGEFRIEDPGIAVLSHGLPKLKIILLFRRKSGSEIWAWLKKIRIKDPNIFVTIAINL
jgi:hypothetical protein